MTKYILHGGRTRVDCKSNRDFYRAMFDLDKKSINLLIVPFAKPEEERDFSDKLERIKQLNPDKKIIVKQADQKIFEEQITWADVIYLVGGDTKLLKKELDKIPNLKYLFNNKIVAGSSAGFIVLSKYYFDQDYPDSILHGLNILPIKAISHFGLPNIYNKSFQKELSELEKFHLEEGLETIVLAETEFVVREG